MKKLFFSLLVFVPFLFLSSPVEAANIKYGLLENIINYPIKNILSCDVADYTPSLRNSCLETSSSDPTFQEEFMLGNALSAPLQTSMLYKSFAAVNFMIENQPASNQIYVADLLHNINPSLAQPAYAQGLGFASLNPILGIWKAFRNIAYFLFVIIFIVVGFAIMFRAKLNPQTVVSIESSLPKLVVTLLLITFSYAIAGLMIDIMYLVIYLMINLGNAYIFDGTINTTQIALGNNFVSNSLTFIFGRPGAHDSVVWTGGKAIAGLVNTAVSSVLGGLIGTLSKLIGGGIFLAVMAIVILWNMLKVFFSLLTSYIQIILHIVVAPLLLLGNALPGSKAFTNWLKNVAAHLAVFPAIIGMIFLVYALMGIGTQGNIGYKNGASGGFTPPQLKFDASDEFQGLIGIGILLAMPQVLEGVKKAFGVGGGPGGGGGGFMGGMLGGGIGAALAPGLSPFKTVGGLAGGTYKQAVLGGALERAGQASTVGGAITGALRGGLRGAYNPLGVSWERHAIGQKRQEASDAAIKFNKEEVLASLRGKPSSNVREGASSGTGQQSQQGVRDAGGLRDVD